MSPADFRRHARAVVDRIADYLANVDGLPVLAPVRPGEFRAQVAASMPTDGEPLEDILADFDRLVVPATTHWSHPAFFAYFSSSGSGAGILGEMLAAALNVNAMLWRTGPAATELEDACLDWIRQALGLPATFAGEITDTASTSILYALAAARDAAMPEARAGGMAGLPPGRIYCSAETHSATHKAAATLGLGLDGVRHVALDDAFRMDPRALREAIREDRAAGRVPVAVVATAGSTGTAAIDPLRDIAGVCADEGVWLHVDAAYGGSAALVPGMEWVLDGAELADSIVVNPHKWMFVPLDCSALLVRDRSRLARAFSLTAAFLTVPYDEAGAANLMDYGISLGRRFRALKLWFVLRYFGARGLAERIGEHVRLAGLFESWVDAAEEWEVLAPRHLSLVVFRWRGPAGDDGRPESGARELNEANERILERVNAGGRAFLSHTVLDGLGAEPVYALRLAVGNLRTREEHVRIAWEALGGASSVPARKSRVHRGA
ncbi:MAG: pyridoxal-dependent decarboxylase [Gemmatimonadota bacterium]